MKKNLSFIVNKTTGDAWDVRLTNSLNNIPKESTLAFLKEFSKFNEINDTDEIELLYEDTIEEKDVDKVLHQIYYLMKAYWYGSYDVKIGNIDINISYEEWETEIRYEYQNNPNEFLRILEDYKRKVMEEM